MLYWSRSKKIGRLQRVPLREVWRHEAYDFTAWLQNNLDVLNSVLNINLSNAEREQAAGAFSVDLVAEDDGGNPAIIENQLEKSDHDHLGKLITYLSAIGANTAIWIVADPRPEHVGAINWLNASSAASFYLVKVEAVRIGDSPPAPLLTLIVGPSIEGRQVGETKKELAERHDIRKEFWRQLLEKAKSRTRLHANISPSDDNWISTNSGKRGLVYTYVIRKHDAHVELYIDRGQSAAENESMLDSLATERDQIEQALGAPLDWQRLEGKRGCRIKKQINIGGYRDEERWSDVQDAMIDSMIRLEAALRPYINQLPN